MMYLQALTSQLSDRLARLSPEVRNRHAGYLRDVHNADGGFSGREGGSDLYYTGFALRGLAVLDALTPQLCEKTADYLKHCLNQHASVIDLFSLLYSCLLVQAGGGPDVLADSPADWPQRVAQTLETFRTGDGGYGKTAGAASGSTYHTFLVALCYQLLGQPLPRVAEVAAFVHSRQRDDGGFVEIAPMRRSGTNPTAAAVGVLQLIQSSWHAPRAVPGDGTRSVPATDGTRSAPAILVPEMKERVIDFLAAMPSPDGGLRANDRAPLSDLLSTFTGCWTLFQLDALDRLDLPALAAFAHAVELPGGGFRAGLWDDRADVEYTFYGLGLTALTDVKDEGVQRMKDEG